jgi:hypothetical protein
VSVGVCFVSTGGNKMSRALRSFRRAEPDFSIHVAVSTDDPFELQPNVEVRRTSSEGYINGYFNEAVKWMRELGYTHACLLHDDTVFSPLVENIRDLSKWFLRLNTDEALQQASALTLSFMEALVDPPPEDKGRWHRPPEFWDAHNLESMNLWQKLCPDGKSAMYFGSEGAAEGTRLDDWFVKYFVIERITTMSRLGPCGFIIPIATWEVIGGFSEDNGIFYDMEYPVICAMKGMPPVKVIPNVPFIHIHCQSTIANPAVGIWGQDLQSFITKYGKDPASVLWDQPNGGGY